MDNRSALLLVFSRVYFSFVLNIFPKLQDFQHKAKHFRRASAHAYMYTRSHVGLIRSQVVYCILIVQDPLLLLGCILTDLCARIVALRVDTTAGQKGCYATVALHHTTR